MAEIITILKDIGEAVTAKYYRYAYPKHRAFNGFVSRDVGLIGKDVLADAMQKIETIITENKPNLDEAFVLEFALEWFYWPPLIDLLLKSGASPNLTQTGNHILESFTLLRPKSPGRYENNEKEIRDIILSLKTYNCNFEGFHPDYIARAEDFELFVRCGLPLVLENETKLFDYFMTRNRWTYISHKRFLSVLDAFKERGVDIVSALDTFERDLPDDDDFDYSICFPAFYWEYTDETDSDFEEREIEIHDTIYYKVYFGLDTQTLSQDEIQYCKKIASQEKEILGGLEQ